MLSQFRSNRKRTGGLYNKISKKKKSHIGRDFLPMKLSEEKRKKLRSHGGNSKATLLASTVVNVLDPSTNTVKKAKIITVKENAANPHFVRMNIVTKGAVIETDAGLAKVTSRPGQHGTINAVLVKQK